MSIDGPRPSGRSPYGGRRPASDPPRPYTPLWRRLREDEWPPLDEVLRGRREQMSPWVLLVLLLPFLWWLTVPLLVGYQLARTARRMARRVFPVRPEGHVEDPEVLLVQRVRAWAALVMSGRCWRCSVAGRTWRTHSSSSCNGCCSHPGWRC
ncbi:hypothetical protein [Streptomyces sp. 769]|uniref:hypothetical protein n=1 Tax=Streptomyces sp. 769 TaxID=1262452 RepID=UPI0005821CCD|nr:hypothetical protein GZL_02200 [Streptomyces sp. 769]